MNPNPAVLAKPARRRRVLCPIAERNVILSPAYLAYVLGRQPRPDTRP